MKMQRCQSYPVSTQRLVAALTSPECYAERYHLVAADESAFELWQQSAEGLRIRACKQVPMRTDKLPRLLRPFIAEQMPLYMEFFWRGYQPDQQPEQQPEALTGELRLWLGKLPLEVKGRVRISGQGDNSEQLLQLELISHLPLLGKKVLERAESKVDELLQEDQRSLLAYLGC